MPSHPATTSASTLTRPEVVTVLQSLHQAAQGDRYRFLRVLPAVLLAGRGKSVSESLKPETLGECYIPVSPEVGQFLYMTARTIGARQIVEFGTSFGISTIYLAAAVRDNGGGHVIGSELLPHKHQAATTNLQHAGLADLVDVRLGDATETLKDVHTPIDMLFLDGWKNLYLPILKLLQPRLRPGALVLADNITGFKQELQPYLDYVQSGRHGFQSMTLSLSDGLEYSYYTG